MEHTKKPGPSFRTGPRDARQVWMRGLGPLQCLTGFADHPLQSRQSFCRFRPGANANFADLLHCYVWGCVFHKNGTVASLIPGQQFR